MSGWFLLASAIVHHKRKIKLLNLKKINHERKDIMVLLMLDITNCDYFENTAREVYLNIPVKHLYKNKLKTILHLLTYGHAL